MKLIFKYFFQKSNKIYHMNLFLELEVSTCKNGGHFVPVTMGEI
jgi:hypothetical protein